MTDIWVVLDIEPTSDASVIRKAYAKKLKVHHPEDDPAGYQRLREAYDRALKHTKQTEARHMADSEPDSLQSRSEWMAMDEKVSVAVKEHPVDVFLERVEVLYENFHARMELKNWEQLLSSDVTWDIEYSAAIQEGLIEFLRWHYHLPHAVWQAIDTTFRFKEQQEELEGEYGEETIRFLIDRINGLRGMRYDIFTGEEEIDYDGYFQLREDIQELLSLNDLDAAKIELDKAYQIYDRDPDFFNMKAVYHTRKGEIEFALDAYGKMLFLHPKDEDALLARAHLYYSEERYIEALQELEQLLTLDAEHMEALVLRMKCRVRCLEDWEIARKEVDTLMEKGVTTTEMYSYMHKIYKNSTVSLGSLANSNALTFVGQSIFLCLYIAFHLVQRAWFYIGLLIVTVVTPASSVYTAILSLLILWEAVKLYKVYIRQ